MQEVTNETEMGQPGGGEGSENGAPWVGGIELRPCKEDGGAPDA